jgi:two-component system chemotaxis response regulator CheY
MMPDMDGIDVLRAIRRDPALQNVSVLMYSADSSYVRMKEAMREGAQAYLVKGTIGWDALVKEVKQFE